MRRRTRSHIFREETTPPPSPPPKKPKRLPPKERPRPKVAYDLVNDVPVSTEEPNTEALPNPLSFEESKAFAYSLYVSRRNWMSGTMFETCWTRKQRGKRLDAGEQAAKDKMSRFCDCTLVLGPHTFANTKLYFVKEEEEVEDRPPQPLQPPQPQPQPPVQPQIQPQNVQPQTAQPVPPANEPKVATSETASETASEAASVPEPKTEETKANVEPVSTSETEPTTEAKTEATETEKEKTENKPAETEAEPAETKPAEPETQTKASKSTEADSEPNAEPKEKESEKPAEPEAVLGDKPAGPVSSAPMTAAPTSVPPAGGAPGGAPGAAPGTAPATGAGPSGPGGPGPGGLPRPAPNPVVARLQQMARNDPALAALMRDVATGKASSTSMTLFQSYIARARQSEVFQSRRYVRKVVKSVSLAFELEENPSERFLLPRDAVVEVLEDGDILWSFLHTSKTTPPGEEKEVTMYTPVTVVLRDIPEKATASVDMCIERYDKVVEKMKTTMEEGTRCDEQYVWYQVDKHDAGIMDEIKRMAPPLLHVAPPKRLAKGGKAGAGGAKDEDDGPAQPAAPRAPRVRPTTYPQVSEHLPAPAPTPIPLLRPKLDLPDINSFKLPPGGMPPMPASLAARLNLPPIPGGPTAPRPPPAAAAAAATETVKSEDTKST